MKKTLVALAVTAFAASASAVTVYENEGSKVDFDGSVRLLLSKETSKTIKGNTTTKTDKHSNLANQGSRFGISVKHNITEDFYGLARYETRFNSGSSNTAGWGDITTNQAYVGLGGHGHQVTFGKQLLIGDEIGQAGFDKKYDVGSDKIEGGFDILNKESDSAIYYSYTGIKGLKLGANYNFANARNVGDAKAGYGVGAVYTADIAEGQALTLAAGYTHDDFKSGTVDAVTVYKDATVTINGQDYVVRQVDTAKSKAASSFKKKNKDGVYVALAYKFNNLTVAVDGGRGVEKQDDDKTTLKFVRTGAKYLVTPAVGVYGNYSYGVVRKGHYKNTAHQFLVGADYKLHKNVLTFVEFGHKKQKDSNNVKRKDNNVGVGLRVFW